MQIFLSTTFYGSTATDIKDVLKLLDKFNIDGIELGSTHLYCVDIENIVRKKWSKRIVVHNFFPPKKDLSFVVNIASDDIDICNQSISYAKYCIKVAASIGAEVYTIHPGFMAIPDLQNKDSDTYDFHFSSKRIQKELAFSNMLRSLSELIDTAKQYHIKLAVEPEGSLTEPGVLLMETMDEYDRLFLKYPEDLYLNMNLAHTRFAAKEHKYDVEEFINRYYDKIALVELSHNNGKIDEHKPLVKESYVFDYLHILPDVPHILEFRNSTGGQGRSSIELIT